MTEQEVWEQAGKIWEKREKIQGLAGLQICIYHKLESKNLLNLWQVILRANSVVYFFTTKAEVHRFLDGLE